MQPPARRPCCSSSSEAATRADPSALPLLPRSDSDDRGPRCAAGGRPSRRRPAVRRPVASSSRALPTPRAGWPSASGHLEARRRRHRAGRVRHGGSIPARRSGPADRRDFVVTSPPTPTPADRERSVAVVDLPLGRIGRLPFDARSGDALPDRPYGTSEHRTGVKVPNCGGVAARRSGYGPVPAGRWALTPRATRNSAATSRVAASAPSGNT